MIKSVEFGNSIVKAFSLSFMLRVLVAMENVELLKHEYLLYTLLCLGTVRSHLIYSHKISCQW